MGDGILGPGRPLGKHWPYKLLNPLPLKARLAFLLRGSEARLPPRLFDLGAVLQGCRTLLICLPEDRRILLDLLPQLRAQAGLRGIACHFLGLPETLHLLEGFFPPDQLLPIPEAEFYLGEPEFNRLKLNLQGLRADYLLNLHPSPGPLLLHLFSELAIPLKAVWTEDDLPVGLGFLRASARDPGSKKPSAPPADSPFPFNLVLRSKGGGERPTGPAGSFLLKPWNFIGLRAEPDLSTPPLPPAKAQGARQRIQALGLEERRFRIWLWPEGASNFREAALPPSGEGQALLIARFGDPALPGIPDELKRRQRTLTEADPLTFIAVLALAQEILGVPGPAFSLARFSGRPLLPFPRLSPEGTAPEV